MSNELSENKWVGVRPVSGTPISIKEQVPSKVSAGVIQVGTSGTRFPNVEGARFEIRTLASTVVFIGGASTVNSGVGIMVAGDPATSPIAKMKFSVDNLNKLYGIALTSSPVTFIAYSW